MHCTVDISKKNFMAPFYGWGSTVSRLEPLQEAVYFLPEDFCLNLKYLGWQYREHIKTAMNGGFCEELLSENDFDVLLATFCCYEHGANASETVQRIVTNQKEYSKYSLYIIIC